MTHGPDSPENPHAGQGTSVLLDIGGDIGALIVTMPVEMTSMEVDIVPEGTSLEQDGHVDHGHDDESGHGHGHGDRPHVAVVRRSTAAGEVPSLVYPELVEGRYQLLEKGTHEVRLAVEVRGGEVTTVDWPV